MGSHEAAVLSTMFGQGRRRWVGWEMVDGKQRGSVVLDHGLCYDPSVGAKRANAGLGSRGIHYLWAPILRGSNLELHS